MLSYISKDKLKHIVEDNILPRTKVVGDCLLFTGSLDKGGYGRVSIWNSSKKRSEPVRVHRLACAYYNDYSLDDLHVLHTCDTPNCISEKHLLLGTHVENMADMASKKRINNSGSRNGFAVLTETIVLQAYASKESVRVLANRFNVSMSTLYAVRNKQNWKELTDFYDLLLSEDKHWRLV